ncbi:hypothetical protein MCHIJ_37640 [Mycolicibacterium chitae]|nr:hypothetical protein MCHIJ_37640 [Mycolicibacterium chitae]
MAAAAAKLVVIFEIDILEIDVLEIDFAILTQPAISVGNSAFVDRRECTTQPSLAYPDEQALLRGVLARFVRTLGCVFSCAAPVHGRRVRKGTTCRRHPSRLPPPGGTSR